MVTASRMTSHRDKVRHWRERLPHARAGLRVTEAFGPVLEEWVGRGSGGLSFHTTQMLSGHGCFGEYLNEKARREASTKCHYCKEERDTAQHTLEVCPAWANKYRVLTDRVGVNLFLLVIVRKMLDGPEGWNLVTSFCLRGGETEGERPPGFAEEETKGGGRRRRVYLQQHQ
ncbi:uncharacterized protein LOC105203114 [Solenopsis invicta]|uniref:uncharacterized protein LOC105203114 n=1 Tax=Solenopsis invicta TaxID=13686 RepID=UPI000595EF1E|nr:uncharacterized protein LOC105203114 [Solenopsis invicta]